MNAPNPRSIRVALLVLCLGAAPLAATNYTITIDDDNETTNGDCSLREAIRAANTDLAVDACPAGSGDDVITLDSVSVIFDGGHETVTGSNGALTIQGATTDKTDAAIGCGLWDNRFLHLSGADVTLQNLSISFCDSGSDPGGVVYASGSDLTVRNVSLSLNKADWYGGAIYFLSNGFRELRVEDSQIGLNGLGEGPAGQDPWGGGILAKVQYQDSIVIANTIFGGNSLNSATRPSEGGGLHIAATGTTTVTLRGLVFEENTCAAAAGAFHRGCGLYLYLGESASALLADSMLVENDAVAADNSSRVTGAEIRLADDATLLAERLFLLDNVGGGSASTNEIQMRVTAYDDSSALMRDVVVAGGQTGLVGELVGSTSASLRFDHFTVTENEEGVVFDEEASTGGSITLQNSILWNNSIYEIDDNGVASLPSNNLGGANPYFYDPVNDDFRLTAISPDRNAGDEALAGVGFCDLDHAPRVVGTHTDRGAYELGGIFADDFESGDTYAWSAATA